MIRCSALEKRQSGLGSKYAQSACFEAAKSLFAKLQFEQLFERPHALARQRNGPLAEERLRYLAHCAEQQMSPRTLRVIAIYLIIIAKALRLTDRPGELIARAEIEAEADRWADRQPKPPNMRSARLARLRFNGNATRWLSFLGRLQPPVTIQRRYAEHVSQFNDYMLRERGLSPRTAEYRCREAHEFLARIDEAGLHLGALTAAQVDDLLAKKVRDEGYARVTIQTYASTLRAFFRYAEGCGWCRPGLAAAIMAPRVFPYETLPEGLTWDDVNRALAAAQGDRPADIRDRALLMLLAVYGLRSSEVVGLCLEDFDWERGLLTVSHGKRGKPRTYPLCRPVGDAVLRYLREVRPRSSRREVFLTLRAPFRPLPWGGLGQAVRRRLHALNVTLRHYGPHALRHSCATHLLAQGLSLKEIGDHLGHQSPETTRIYAKVDMTGLRAVGDFDLEGLL
jgi:site-specific recombinase XerD